MPEPELPRPDATAYAMGRALHALNALLPSLGEGNHELNITADHTNGAELTADLTVSAEPGSLRVTDSDKEYAKFFVLLTFALEHSTVHDAVLIATTADDPPRACGWEVRAGWLHPMDTAVLQDAAADDAAPHRVHAAPVLHRPLGEHS